MNLLNQIISFAFPLIKYIFHGLLPADSNTILTDIKAFSILTQQWSTTVSSSTFGRDYFKADTDDRNMIHYFGGYFNNSRLFFVCVRNSKIKTMKITNALFKKANFNDVVALTCLPGQYNNAGICTPCPAAAWSSAFNATSCTLCSANTSSSVVGAVSINSCVSCPLYTSSPVGSTGCTCNPGYQPSNGYWACNICNPGTYKADQGNTTCTQCPANTYSSIFGATSNTTCLSCGLGAVSATGSSSCSCNVGYTVSGSSCAQCAAGNFKNTIGNGTCTQCSANTYSTSGATVCITCGPNSASSVGSSSCTCNAGYYPNGMGCSACLAGTFKSSSGNSSCTNCDVNQWSSTGAISCNSCGSGAVSVSGSASCSCDLGYTASGNTCIQCGAGTYKSAVGNGTCTQCPVNTFSSVVGATSISTCIGCGSNAGSSIGSTSCACNAGYFSSGASCIACAAGTFKGTTGNSSCTNCSTNQWSAAGASSCIGCETGAVSVAGSASCSCTSGYTPILNTCAQCPAGSYKSTIGNITCTLCASNTYSETLGATSNTTCIACGQNSESVTGSGACSCVAGYYSNASACVACPAGTYKSSTGNTTCSNCTANQASGIGSITCGSCGLGAVSNAGSNVCACDLGYAYNGTACVQCAAGSYKSTVGNVTCTQCIANSFSPVTGAIANSTCFSCGPNAVSVAGSSSCSCMVGYESNGVSCLACPAGRVKANIGNDTVCVNCLANQYSLPASSTCLQCGANTVSAAGSSFCECNAGYELVNGDCVACTAGKFKPLSGNSTCQDCAANDYSLQGALTCLQCGVNALSVSGSPNCSCNSGYFGNPFSVCQKCPVNKYRSGVAFNNTTSSDCLVCPSNSGTNGTDGATGISQCICNAGYYRDTLTGTCTPCSMDTFKSRSGNELCTVCSTGTSTGNNNGSTICSVCDAGFNGTAPNCQPCETGLTKPNAGNGACTLPATSSASPSPSATASESSSPTGNPETKPPQSPANPLAAMMGISDELFFIIVGAVGAVFVATVSVVIIIRMRRKKRQVLARQSAMKRMQTIQAMQTLSLQRNLQQSNMNTTFNSNYAQVPLLSPQANSLVPYGTSPTSHTMVSLPGRSGVGHTMSSFQPMTKTYSMNGGATTTYAGPTLATMGPNWTTRRV